MEWFRFYNESLNSRKIQSLSPALFKHWVNLLCVARIFDGRIPPAEAAWRLRLSDRQMEEIFAELGPGNRRLMEPNEDGTYTPHDWDEHQPPSDDSASRKREQRARRKRDGYRDTSRDTSRYASGTSPVLEQSRADTEQRQSRAENVSPTIDLAGFTERLYQAGQPGKRRNRTLAEQAICEAVQRGKIGESGVPMETVESRWIAVNASEDWGWKSGAKAQTLAEWVTDGNYRYEAPPATAAVSKREATNRAIEERLMRDFLEAQNG